MKAILHTFPSISWVALTTSRIIHWQFPLIRNSKAWISCINTIYICGCSKGIERRISGFWNHDGPCDVTCKSRISSQGLLYIWRVTSPFNTYPPLFNDPEGDSCFSIYQIRWIKKCCFNFFFWNFRETTPWTPPRVSRACGNISVMPECSNHRTSERAQLLAAMTRHI